MMLSVRIYNAKHIHISPMDSRCLINGGQGVNRTPDTRIFSPLL
ncbi:uncharacterized protein METZ01_LOCUS329043, partial [marine metagenome]